MSTTMRTTLQTVPESLPADHITNAAPNAPATTATTTVPTETTTTKPSHNHPTAALKGRQSSTKVCDALISFPPYFQQIDREVSVIGVFLGGICDYDWVLRANIVIHVNQCIRSSA